MNIQSHHRRKNKIPRKRNISDCVISQATDDLNDNNVFNNDIKEESIENISLNDTENLKRDSNKSFKMNYTQISAVQLIYDVIPSPRFEIQSHQLKSLYDEIRTMCENIDELIDRYIRQHASTILQNIQPNADDQLSNKSNNQHFLETENFKETLLSDCSTSVVKRKTFRGTSDEENEINPSYKPIESNNEVILSKCYPEIKIGKDLFYMMLLKASNSATRLIRLLMKNYFNQKTLAVSSLSGEGYYKQKLNSQIISAIKDFIKLRHPKLKNGSINLCMTDVCVQARRVYRTKSKTNVSNH